jgi:hypothetical protein
VHGEALAQNQAALAAPGNNPLADMTVFNSQSDYTGELPDSDKSARRAWLRGVSFGFGPRLTEPVITSAVNQGFQPTLLLSRC